MTRWALPADAGALADVHVEAWRKAYEGILPEEYLAGLDREARVRFWGRKLQEGERVNVCGNPVIGFCLAGDSDEEGWGEVFAIYVHPDHWGEGVGARLLQAGERQLREADHERALLWVLRDNQRARHFYERQGWKTGKPIRLEEIGGIQFTEVRYEIEL